VPLAAREVEQIVESYVDKIVEQIIERQFDSEVVPSAARKLEKYQDDDEFNAPDGSKQQNHPS
jgi:hypothetical protein